MYRGLIVEDVRGIVGRYREKIGYLREVGEREGRNVGERGSEDRNDL